MAALPENLTLIGYLVAAVCFIIALKGLSAPGTARRGNLIGAAGGLLAVLLLVVAKIAIVDPLAQDFALIAAPDTIDFKLLIGLLLASGIAVSALGSGLSLRRFLRV